jgi:hypothetical protein
MIRGGLALHPARIGHELDRENLPILLTFGALRRYRLCQQKPHEQNTLSDIPTPGRARIGKCPF